MKLVNPYPNLLGSQVQAFCDWFTLQVQQATFTLPSLGEANILLCDLLYRFSRQPLPTQIGRSKLTVLWLFTLQVYRQSLPYTVGEKTGRTLQINIINIIAHLWSDAIQWLSNIPSFPSTVVTWLIVLVSMKHLWGGYLQQAPRALRLQLQTYRLRGQFVKNLLVLISFSRQRLYFLINTWVGG